jgi:hypothetical protein
MLGKKERTDKGFEDQELEGAVDNGDFKRADVGSVANPSFGTPSKTPKRYIPDDELVKESAFYTGEELQAAQREQKVAAREHFTSNAVYRIADPSDDGYDFGSPQLLLGEDVERAKVTIKCVEGFMAVGSLNELSGRSGYWLAAGETLETEVQDALYFAISNGHATTSYTYWAERN